MAPPNFAEFALYRMLFSLDVNKICPIRQLKFKNIDDSNHKNSNTGQHSVNKRIKSRKLQDFQTLLSLVKGGDDSSDAFCMNEVGGNLPDEIDQLVQESSVQQLDQFISKIAKEPKLCKAFCYDIKQNWN